MAGSRQLSERESVDLGMAESTELSERESVGSRQLSEGENVGSRQLFERESVGSRQLSEGKSVGSRQLSERESVGSRQLSEGESGDQEMAESREVSQGESGDRQMAGSSLDGECWYSVLGVDLAASPEEILSAFRAVTIKWCRDKAEVDCDESTARFETIYTAYRILSDPEARRCYDELQSILNSIKAFREPQARDFDFREFGYPSDFDLDFEASVSDFFSEYGYDGRLLF